MQFNAQNSYIQGIQGSTLLIAHKKRIQSVSVWASKLDHNWTLRGITFLIPSSLLSLLLTSVSSVVLIERPESRVQQSYVMPENIHVINVMALKIAKKHAFWSRIAKWIGKERDGERQRASERRGGERSRTSRRHSHKPCVCTCN